jgi:hypothetical protein
MTMGVIFRPELAFRIKPALVWLVTFTRPGGGAPLFAVILPDGEILDQRIKEPGSTRVFWRRPELSTQPSKATFVNHVVQGHLVGEKVHRLDPEVQPFDIDLLLLAMAGNDERTEPVNVALENPIGVLADFHGIN